MKKQLSAMFTIAILLFSLSAFASENSAVPSSEISNYAETAAVAEDFAWSIDAVGTLTISGNGAMPTGTMPWSAQKDKIKSIVFEENITSISSSAFAGCTGLTQLNIPSTVTYIYYGAFSGCKNLTEVTLPFVGVYGSSSFAPIFAVSNHELAANFPSLTKVTITNTATLASGAFNNCTSLTEINLPESLTSIGGNAFDNCPNLIILCVPESYAEKYAIDNNIPYAYANAGNTLKLSLKSTGGNEIAGGFTVNWYEKDSGVIIGSGISLNNIDINKQYQYKIVLGEDLSYTYYQPEKRDAVIVDENYELACTLEEIPIITVTGKMTGEEGEPLSGVEILFSQTYNNQYKKEQTVTADENGAFSAPLANVYTTAVFSLSGYYSKTRTIIESSIDGDLHNVGSVALIKLPENKITLSLNMTYATKDGNENLRSPLTSANNLTFSIRNITQNKDISDFTIVYPSLIIGDGAANANDTISISVIDDKHEMTAAAAHIILDENKMGEAEITFIQNGSFEITGITGNAQNTVMIFDGNGKFIKSGYAASSFTSGNMASGEYTLVIIKKTELLRNVPTLSKLSELGLSEGDDYVLKSITIQNGKVSELADIAVPRLDESRLYYTINANTEFTANHGSVTVGKFITMRAEYEISSKYEGTNQTVKIEIPDGVSFVDGSLTTDGQIAPYTRDAGAVTIVTNKAKGVVRFYVIAEDSGSYNVNAYLSFNCSGAPITQPIGTATFEATASKIVVPEKTSAKKITVSGTAIAGSTITVFSNDFEVGKTTPNKNGSWSVQIELVKPYNYSYHDIHAQIENSRYEKPITTAVATTLYDKNYVEISKVDMIYNGQTIVFDFLNPANKPSYYSYVPGQTSYTFVAEFTESDYESDYELISNASVIATRADGTSAAVPLTYDAGKNRWIGTYDCGGTSGIPAKVGVDWDYLPPQSGDYAPEDSENAADFLKEFSEQSAQIGENISYALVDDSDQRIEFEMLLGENKITNVIVSDCDYSRYADIVPGENGFTISDDEYDIYSKNEFTEDGFLTTMVDKPNAYAFQILVALDYGDISEYVNPSEPTPVHQFTLMNAALDPQGGNQGWTRFMQCIPLFGEYSLTFVTEQLRRDMNDKNEEFTRTMNKLVAYMSQKCPDGTLKLGDNYSRALSMFNALNSDETLFAQDCYEDMRMLARKAGLSLGFSALFEGISGALRGLIAKPLTFKEYHAGVKAIGNKITYKELVRYSNLYNKTVDTINTQRSSLVNMSGGTQILMDNLDAFDFSTNALYLKIQNGYADLIYTRPATIMKYIFENQKCEKEPEEPEMPDNNQDSPFGIDPSGYIYEAVPSNRVEGVKAECYYYDYALDEFGVPADDKSDILWDAEEYDQVNPLYSDKNGMYAWDVPMGDWLVKFSKTGYYDTDSRNDIAAADNNGYLPVPPPQTEVNTAIISKALPTVESMNAYSDAIQIIFSQYMRPDTVNSDTVSVKCGGMDISGVITPTDAESNYDNSAVYAKTFIFTPSVPLSDIVTVTIEDAENYNGAAMSKPYAQSSSVTIMPEGILAAESVSVAYNSGALTEIQILPVGAGANKTLSITSSSPSIVGVVGSEITADENGKANIMLSGNLPGEGEITISLCGTDIKRTVKAVVGGVITNDNKCAKVTASAESGAKLAKGSTVELTTQTEGAQIYYTLDGTCPCDVGSASRMLYTEPITVDDYTFIIAYAVKDGMDDSATAGFVYNVYAPLINCSALITPTEKGYSVGITLDKEISNATIFVAQKDEEDNILSLSSLRCDGKSTYSPALPNDANATSVDIFIWDENMLPISEKLSAAIE